MLDRLQTPRQGTRVDRCRTRNLILAPRIGPEAVQILSFTNAYCSQMRVRPNELAVTVYVRPVLLQTVQRTRLHYCSPQFTATYVPLKSPNFALFRVMYALTMTSDEYHFESGTVRFLVEILKMLY